MVNKHQNLAPVIGLEIHLEIKTKSKIFCSCLNDPEEKTPNKNVCPICLGHPGVLPSINKQALIKTLKLGIALHGKINLVSYFERKNYFYPDLPKAYQISQFACPLIKGGFLMVNGKKISFDNIHLEEDTAKLIHSSDKAFTCLDFNRAGVPLLEATTEPVIESPEEAKMFLQEFQLLARYLDISSAAMEKGQMRCDANLSLRPVNSQKLFPKVEIKNLNSFHSVEQALRYEIERQRKMWEQGTPPVYSSTRGWDEKRKETFPQREKEQAKDYRYFPEPDLLVYNISSLVKEIRIGEGPFERRERFKKEYGFNSKQAYSLTKSKLIADFTEEVISELKSWFVTLKNTQPLEKYEWEKQKQKVVDLLGNWMINRFLPLFPAYVLESSDIKDLKVTPENFAEFLILIYQRKIPSTVGTEVLKLMVQTGKDVDRVMEEKGIKTIDKSLDIDKIADDLISQNKELVNLYLKGKENILNVFIGKIMAKTKGQVDPEEARKIMKDKLDELKNKT